MALGAQEQRLFIAALFVLGLAAAAAAFAVGFTGALTETLSDRSSAPFVRLVLIWAEAAAVAALFLLACALFAFAWYLRQHVTLPMENVRRSLNGAATGDISAHILGIERKDEVGALARAAERFRQAVVSGADHRFYDVSERLKLSADRLEADLARMAAAAREAQMRVEESSARAARASHVATEAAGLARDGAVRIVQKAEDSVGTIGLQARLAVDALTRAVTRIAGATPRLDPFTLPESRSEGALVHADSRPVLLLTGTGELRPESGDAILEDLIGDLDALERFARGRKTIASEQAVALTVSLVEAIDRLNAVADQISAAADESPIRAAG